MAFVFSSLANVEHGNVKVDIICVPAIGADPRNTWARPDSQLGHNRLDYALHDRLYPSAQTHLYDHLTPEERKLEVKAAQEPNDAEHKRSAEAFAAAESAVAEYGIVEWADRLLDVVRQHRKAQRTQGRPVLVICHSTGGTVVKQALSKRAEQRKAGDITGLCLGVIFFATPHHGSSVLSQPEYVQTVRDRIGLKWEMSERLRQEFELRNPDLDTLNYTFAKSVVGTKIHSYVESADTTLTVLSSNDAGGESITTVRLCITDSRSGKLSTPEIPIEDEEVVQLNCTHVGAPRFTDEEGFYHVFLKETCKLVETYSDEQRTSYQALNKSILTGIEVDVHQFYGETGEMKILSAHPTLEEFLESGPNQCMAERIRGSDHKDRSPVNGVVKPTIELRHASESSAPALTVTTADLDDPFEPRAESQPTLSPPIVTPPKNIHTRRPSLTKRTSSSTTPGHGRRSSLTPQNPEPESPGHLGPNTSNPKQVQFSMAPLNKSAQVRVHRATPFKLPSSSTDRFKWIHVPFNHSHWVSHVLTTISQEKDDPKLHSKLLLDKIWFLQHNRSRHASPHARFVRPAVKCLLPEGAPKFPTDGFTTPAAAGDDAQFVLYLPYLHWDSFAAMQKRASIIKRRREQEDARPIPGDVSHGKSLEHKVIWQYLTTDRPVHCRRTLDQYGYPSLRNTTVRDGDQILYKRTRLETDTNALKDAHKHKLQGVRPTPDPHSKARYNPAFDDVTAKVLMVDQLWLWIIDNQTVITFFTPKEREDDQGLSREGDIRSTIYQDINGDYANQCSDPWDFAALAVSHAVKALLENVSDKKLQVFSIFEEYISILTELQTLSFKEFRNSQRLEKKHAIQAQSHVDNHKDLDALLELRDIEDELNTIEKLLDEQEKCVKEMIAQYGHLNRKHGKGLNGIDFLHDVVSFLAEHREQVDGMLKSAQAAQHAFKDLLDMKQKQANVVEAQLARKQTEVAADQSRSVMIFTIFTIIFLPLSFFASVFGINAREWSGNDNSYLPLHQIFTYMGSISLAVIIIALLVAFNRHSRRLAQKLWRGVALPVLNFWQRVRGQPARNDEGAFGGKSAYGLDLEKANEVDKERTAKRLSTISRTYSKLNWEEDAFLRQQGGSAY